MRKWILFAGTLFAALFSASCGGNTPAGNDSAEVVLYTSLGAIRVELDGRTPRHRDNFIKLTREGFFDSVLFHRVIADFMIQAGDPDSRCAPAGMLLGESDAGYLLPSEIVYPELAHTRGALSAARTSDEVNPDRQSSSSQFFIVSASPRTDEQLSKGEQRVHQATAGRVTITDSLRTLYKTKGGTPQLDGQYTVFGRVVDGMNVVDSIQRVAVDSMARPLVDVRILRAEVTREPGVTN